MLFQSNVAREIGHAAVRLLRANRSGSGPAAGPGRTGGSILYAACVLAAVFAFADSSAAGGKPDGARCHVGKSCRSGLCVTLNPTDKFGECCTPKDCPELGAQCGTIDNGCGLPIGCGSCAPGGQCVDNLCSTPTTTTSSTTSTTTTTTTSSTTSTSTTSTTSTTVPASTTSTTTTSTTTSTLLDCPAADNTGSDAVTDCPCVGTFDCCGICSATHFCTGATRPPAGPDPGGAPSCP